MRTVPIDDTIAIAVPERFESATGAKRELLLKFLTLTADRTVAAQYRPGSRPAAILLDPPEWLITRDPAELERFQPAHDCPACLAGQDQAKSYLREHPDRSVALANLHYREVWA